jgi:transforming growth factor-beta-induced protein
MRNDLGGRSVYAALTWEKKWCVHMAEVVKVECVTTVNLHERAKSMCKNKRFVGVMAVVLTLSVVGNLARVKAAEATGKKAISPSPKDGATDARRDGTSLSWTPGQTTPKYDVYIGTIKKYVEQVTRESPVYVVASLGQKTTTFSPGRLELGQTYYWRVDELDDSDPAAVKIVKGDVWTFMVEVPALPVGNVTATASGSDGGKPEKTVDGSATSTDRADMWLSNVVTPVAKDPKDPNGPKQTPATWVQFQFGKVQRLYDMTVWNWNAKDSLEYGVKDITVQSSNNGTDWTAMGDFTLAKGSGTADNAGQTISLAGVTATYVKIVVKTGYGNANQYGLSEVKFTAIPVYAREPSPAPATQNASLGTTLSWRVGREAASHKLFISTDKTAVEKGTAQAVTLDKNSFDLGSLDAKLGSTYYWRVDEVNDTTTPKSFAGDVWSFSTPEYLVLDDFEAYTDNLAGTWGVSGSCGLAIGKSTVHAGKQSLVMSYPGPLFNFTPSGWATRTITNQKNWTKNGIKSLLIFLRGDVSNVSVPFFVRINDVQVNFTGNVASPWWSCWSVDVASLGATAGNVDTITIGFSMPGNVTGKVYIDDIRLSSKAPSGLDLLNQLITLNTTGQYDTLLAGLFAADATIVNALNSDQTYTLFAPTNKAFAAAGVDKTSIGALDKAILNDLLRYHIAAGNVAATFKGDVTTLEGDILKMDAHVVTDELGGKAVITASTDAANGAIHTVNAVLMPYLQNKIVDVLKSMNTTGASAGKFDTLLAAIEAATPVVRDTLGKRSYTLFAPTDDAFTALGYDPTTIKKLDQAVLSDILLYHVVSGEIMSKDLPATIKTVQGGELKQSKSVLTDAVGGQAKITSADIEASNGVIDVVDAVAMPFAKTRLLDLYALLASLNKTGDFAGKLSTMDALWNAADADKVKAKIGTGACTLFAPTDAAFKAAGLDPNTVKALIVPCSTDATIAQDAKTYLTDVLLYHLVSGKVKASSALATQQLVTLQGEIMVGDAVAGVLVSFLGEKAKIITADLEAANGMIQVIDSAMLPSVYVPKACPKPKFDVLTTIDNQNKEGDNKGKFDTFLAAISAADPSVKALLAGKDLNTVFVPTNEAFAAIGLDAQKVAKLNKLVLTDILKYNIATGKVLAANLPTKIIMLKGGTVQQANGTLTDNTGAKAKIVQKDIDCTNGVMQVINAVLLPAPL